MEHSAALSGAATALRQESQQRVEEVMERVKHEEKVCERVRGMKYKDNGSCEGEGLELGLRMERWFKARGPLQEGWEGGEKRCHAMK